MVKYLPTMRETQVRFLGPEDPLEKEMATHYSILAWKIPWTEEPGWLQSMESHKRWTWLSNWAQKRLRAERSWCEWPDWIRWWSENEKGSDINGNKMREAQHLAKAWNGDGRRRKKKLSVPLKLLQGSNMQNPLLKKAKQIQFSWLPRFDKSILSFSNNLRPISAIAEPGQSNRWPQYFSCLQQ